VGYKIYAIRYGDRDDRLRSQDFYLGDLHDGPHPMNYYMWAIVGDDRSAYVVDAGYRPDTAAKRGRNLLCDPLEVLGSLGVDVATQRDVILTHLHYDHMGHYGAFPKARIWTTDTEMAFWTGRYASRAGYSAIIEEEDILGLVALNFQGRVQFVDEVTTVAPGITLHPVGGHSPGLQMVRVETGSGAVLLASDAAHFYENFEADRPFTIMHSLVDMYRAFDVMHGLVDTPRNVVPGHDPITFERYRAASPDLDGFVVEITAEPSAAPTR